MNIYANTIGLSSVSLVALLVLVINYRNWNAAIIELKLASSKIAKLRIAYFAEIGLTFIFGSMMFTVSVLFKSADEITPTIKTLLTISPIVFSAVLILSGIVFSPYLYRKQRSARTFDQCLLLAVFAIVGPAVVGLIALSIWYSSIE